MYGILIQRANWSDCSALRIWLYGESVESNMSLLYPYSCDICMLTHVTPPHQEVDLV